MSKKWSIIGMGVDGRSRGTPLRDLCRKILQRVDDFFFRKVSATGFGMMRAAWGAGVFLYFVKQWPDVTRFYSAAGQLPPWLAEGMTNPWPSMSLLWLFPHPNAVFLIYLLLLALSFCACVGYRPHLSVIATSLLLFSFHIRNPWHTTGGDVILSSLGFLLCFAPAGARAFSLDRARLQCRHWMRTQTLLSPALMPVWPQRLVLWQLIIIYGQSLWSKLLGTMWTQGTAVGVALHHTHFGRFAGTPIADLLSAIGPLLGWSVMLWEGCWLLLLIPRTITPWWPGDRLRRWLLASSLFIHTGFYILLRLGSFLIAIPAILLGNLHEEDFVAMRTLANRRWKGSISVFYDSGCGFCRRSMCILLQMDRLERLRPVDFRLPHEHHQWAPDLALKDLDRAMHIRLPKGKTIHGFSAFRSLTWHLPPLWPLAPLLYLPGMKMIGDIVYQRIADNRKTCTHASCGA